MKNRIMKWAGSVLAVVAVLSLLPSCSPQEDDGGQGAKKRIVVTAFPEYDWVRQIVGDKAGRFDLHMLLENGGDLHNYQPSVADIVDISKSHLFVYNGGLSDAWVSHVMERPASRNTRSVNMMSVIGSQKKMEEHVEGMQEGESHHCTDASCTLAHHEESAHDHEHEHEHAHDHEHEHNHADAHGHDDHNAAHEHADEHIWLSLKNAVLICENLTEQITVLDPENAAVYEKNKQDYIAKLQALDVRFAQLAEAQPARPVIIADRFPFLYMMSDYNLPYYAAFSGCSAETEASFETITFLSDKVKETQAHTIFILEGGMLPLAQTIIKNSGSADCQVKELNSIQSVSPSAIKAGETYLSIMERNLENLECALQDKK